MELLRVIERLLLVGGVLAVTAFAVDYSGAQVSAARDIADFDVAMRSLSKPDMALWSTGRVAAYRSHAASGRHPIGILRIERLSIEAPIYSGTTDDALNRGVGWIEGTARPGDDGNIGLAAHRDGYFRGLKDVQIGDRIVTESHTGVSLYEVTESEIVSPQDVHVLHPTSEAKLTLVTCYPFYFVGAAPDRFVVHASRISAPTGRRAASFDTESPE